MASMAILSSEELEQLVARAVEPLRAELAKLRADQKAELVTPGEAARRLGVSVRTVQRLVARGELASAKVGGARRVRLAGVLPPPVPSE